MTLGSKKATHSCKGKLCEICNLTQRTENKTQNINLLRQKISDKILEKPEKAVSILVDWINLKK